MDKTKIIFDLNTAHLFGPACKFTELVESYLSQGFDIELWKKDWIVKPTHKGTTLNKTTDDYEASTGAYLWDPTTHPHDYFENLVDASFNNVFYVNKTYSKWSSIYFLFKRNYISHSTALIFLGDRDERKRFFRQKFKELFLDKPDLIKAFISFLYFFLETRVFIHLKIKPKLFFGMRYKLAKNMNNSLVNNFIEKHKNKYLIFSIMG
jgi:hypothetical protein